MANWQWISNALGNETSPQLMISYPDNKVYGANMGPTWVLSAPDGPHVGPMNLVIKAVASQDFDELTHWSLEDVIQLSYNQ